MQALCDEVAKSVQVARSLQGLHPAPQACHLPRPACLGDYRRELDTLQVGTSPRWGNAFLRDCKLLKRATFQDLPALVSVRTTWLYSCSSLESIHLTGLPLFKEVGNNSLYNCSSLKQATFQDLPSLRGLGDRWLVSCTELESIHVAGLPLLRTVGNYFLRGPPLVR